MAFRSSTGLTGASNNDATIAVPAGAAVGDIAVVGVYKENTAAVSPPTGFTQKAALTTSGTSRGTLYVFWKRLTAADAGTYAFTWSGNTWRAAACALFSGRITTGDPFDGTVGTAESVTTVTSLNVSTSPAAADGDAVDFHTNFQGGNSWTAPANYTERQDLDVIGMFTLDAVASGSTGNVSATANVSGFMKAFLGVLAVAGGGGATDVTPNDATHGHAADQPALTQTHVLADDDAGHAHAADSPTLTQVHALAVDSADHAHTADSPPLTQTHQLASEDAAHGHAADSPTLNQVHILAVDDASHAHAADQAAVTTGGTLAVDDALHGHIADSPVLAQVHLLVADDATHAHTADQPTVASGSTVAADGATHAHIADQPLQTQVHVLAVDDALHGHAADSPALTQMHLLVASDALHTHTADEAPVFLHLPDDNPMHLAYTTPSHGLTHQETAALSFGEPARHLTH